VTLVILAQAAGWPGDLRRGAALLCAFLSDDDLAVATIATEATEVARPLELIQAAVNLLRDAQDLSPGWLTWFRMVAAEQATREAGEDVA